MCRTDGTNLGEVSLPLLPYSSAQQSLTGYNIPEPGGDVLFTVTSGYATGYAVVNDNVTNDADLFSGLVAQRHALRRYLGYLDIRVV